MTVREIRLMGDPVLGHRSREVTSFDGALAVQVADMFDTMYHAGGVGLAANQIGLTNRVFVYDTTRTHGMKGVLINPVWTPLSEDTQTGSEGCLSIPGVRGQVERYQSVSATGLDLEGRPVSIVAHGWTARCIQHETDHLNGTLYLDRLPKEQRQALMAEIHAMTWFK